MSSPGTVTAILTELGGDSRAALDRVFPLLMDELTRLARRQLRGSPPGSTLDTTGLLHEAWLRMAGLDHAAWPDRAHFLAYRARAMRAVLADHARRRTARKRGGGAAHLTLDSRDIPAEPDPEEILALDEALTRLGALSSRQAGVVDCLFFGGLTEEETAGALGVSERTVRRDWVKARAWLLAELAARPPAA